MSEKQNIFQRMSAITAELAPVAKNLSVEIQKGKKYKAVSEADVLAAVKPIEAKHGVYSFPYSRSILRDEFVEKISTYNGQESKRIEVFFRVETKYRFVNVDDPQDYIEITGYGDGVDSQDKAPGKAMTYCDKYCLLKAYKIVTGDDPDQDASGTLTPREPMPPKKISSKIASQIAIEVTALGGNLDLFCSKFGVDTVGEITENQIDAAFNLIDRMKAATAKKTELAKSVNIADLTGNFDLPDMGYKED